MILTKLRVLWDALNMVEWPCDHCHVKNYTSMLVWHSVKFRLICRECSFSQHYPAHISKFDPAPPRDYRERSAS